MNEQKKRKRPLPRSKKEGLMDLAGKYSAEVDSNKVRDTQREDQENKGQLLPMFKRIQASGR